MIKKKIHPIYFNSFVGTWKSPSSDVAIKFNKDCSFEELSNGRGTVNGDVDEVSVEEETYPDTWIKRGKIVLIKNSEQHVFKYRLSSADKTKKAGVLNKLDLGIGKSSQSYVLDYSFDTARKKPSSKNKSEV